MMDLGPHASFIISAYVGVALVIAGLIANTMLDSAKQKRRLAELEAMGIRRRSAANGEVKK